MPAALSIPLNMPTLRLGFLFRARTGLGRPPPADSARQSPGGSSSINGMVYIRGNPLDFDRWQQEGASGWSYADVLPYFRRAERRAEGGNEYRGADGPLCTQYGTPRIR